MENTGALSRVLRRLDSRLRRVIVKGSTRARRTRARAFYHPDTLRKRYPLI